MKSFRTWLLVALLGLAVVPQAVAQSIVGAWSGGDTTKEDAGVLVFFANGTFIYIENVARSEAPSGYPGYERGTYTWDPATNALTLNLLQDLNGSTGIGAASGLPGITATVAGNILTILAPGGGQLIGTRVTGASAIVGAWGAGSTQPDQSAVIVFLPNGVYFMAEDGDSSPATGDPTGHDGIEVGTYTWDPATGALTSSRTPFPYIDTNGEWGLSHTKAGITFKVSPDRSMLTITDGTDVTGLPRAGAASPPALNVQGLWWKAPGGSEDGWGINFAHQGEVIFGTWFTYDTTGKGWWLTLIADDKATPGTYAGKLYSPSGPPFNSVPFVQVGGPPPPVGEATLTFSDANNGAFHYDVNLPSGKISQTKTITRQVLNASPLASCGTQANLAAATNYQDIWWAGTSASPGTESGWGINFAHQGDTLFASWFTYDLDGTPLWLVATGNKVGAGVYSGDLYRPSGPRIDAYDKSKFAANPPVGTMKVTFADGNNATLSYSVQLPGMTTPAVQNKPITRQLFSASGTTCQ